MIELALLWVYLLLTNFLDKDLVICPNNKIGHIALFGREEETKPKVYKVQY